MNAEWIITVFVILDELLAKGGHHDHTLARVGDAEVLTVAVVAAKYFQNYLELPKQQRCQGTRPTAQSHSQTVRYRFRDCYLDC